MTRTQKPEITLIISSSVDGCLVGRDSDSLDSNKDWKDLKIVRGVLQQFFDFSHNNKDVFNLVTAPTLLRVGIEAPVFIPKKENLRLVVIDEDNEINPRGIKNLSLSVEKLIIANTRKNKLTRKYPSNCQFIYYSKKIDMAHLVATLKQKYKVEKLTVSSAGLRNSQWIKTGLVDFITMIIYPLLVSRNGTPAFVEADLFAVKPLHLISAKIFDTNYLSLRYKVIN